LSEWALRHRSLVLYAMVVTAILGAFGFSRLGESEDPPFTFKVMVIQTLWPGASAQQVEREVTDRIERKLQETPNVDFLQSYSRPGESMIFFNIKDEFGDVYTNIYALEGDGYSFAELHDYADKLREELLRVPGVAKVDYFGDQTQVIHVEISNRKLATLGLTPADIEAVLRAQNAVVAAGTY